MTLDCETLLQSYLEWLRAKTSVRELQQGVCEITTPFLDRHNDRLQIYVVPKDGGYTLTDDGYVLGDLEASGCPVNTQQRRQLLDTILRGFGVREEDGVLMTEASLDAFPQKKHALIQAMLAVNDMFLTARRHVASLFIEDVGAFLGEIRARYTPSVAFVGRSGYLHRFDFVIPRSASRPERVLQAVNAPTKDSAVTLIFAWNDTRETRPERSVFYVVLNDDNRISSDVLDAFREYDIRTVPWSQRQRYAGELAA
jgi:hypothetical protein